MTEALGEWEAPKSLILKINDTISLSPLSNLEMVLLKSDAVIDRYTLDTFTGDITAYEQDYVGYARVDLTNITREDGIQDGYVWTADNIEFQALNASMQYALVIDKTTDDIISVLDLGSVITFAGDITFDLNVYGFLSISV